MTKREFDKIDHKHNKAFFFTEMNFLMTHSGLRPGELHFLLGPTGCGKSTLARKIGMDAAKTKPVLFHLSEENVDDYKYKFNKQDRNLAILRNIMLVSENEAPESTKSDHHTFFSWYFENCYKSEADVIILDNITTSFIWASNRPEDQEIAISKLKSYAAKHRKAVLIVVHAKKEITNDWDRVLTPEDVRGNARTAMMAGYWYSMQMIVHPLGTIYFVRVNKARFHDNALWRSFKLGYDKKTGGITGDTEIDNDDLKAFFKDARNGKKKG